MTEPTLPETRPEPTRQKPQLPLSAQLLDDSDPRSVGPYTLFGRLGQGGMGTVYVATRPGGEPVALKTMHPHLARIPDVRQRFAREIANAQRVRSPFTPPLLDADTTAPLPYLVMPYVDGPTLDAEIVANGPLTDDELTQLAVNVLSALVVFHRAGIVHRDVKPSNVILSRTGPRIVDLGISRAVDDAAGLTATGSRQPGTYPVMAPEQWTGLRPTPAIDVFAWACLVVYARTRAFPFAGTTEAELRREILGGSPRLDGLDPAMRTHVEQALAKDPADRPVAADLLVRILGLTGTQVATGQPDDQHADDQHGEDQHGEDQHGEDQHREERHAGNLLPVADDADGGAMTWQVRGSSTRGAGNAEVASRRADAFDWFSASRPRGSADRDRPVYVLVVADGPGQRSRSARATELAVSLAVRESRKALAAFGPPTDVATCSHLLARIFHAVSEEFREVLGGIAADGGLDATLTVVMIAEPFVGVVATGDGFTVVRTGRQLRVLDHQRLADGRGSAGSGNASLLVAGNVLTRRRIRVVRDDEVSGVLVASGGLDGQLLVDDGYLVRPYGPTAEDVLRWLGDDFSVANSRVVTTFLSSPDIDLVPSSGPRFPSRRDHKIMVVAVRSPT